VSPRDGPESSRNNTRRDNPEELDSNTEISIYICSILNFIVNTPIYLDVIKLWKVLLVIFLRIVSKLLRSSTQVRKAHFALIR
jgi:hypothetical protein